MNRILIILFMLSALLCHADKYEIVYLNTKTISIDGKELKVGDIFDDTSTISWISNRQAMKVKNVQTKAVKIFSSKQFEKSNSIKDYYLKLNHLSTRGDMMDESELAEYLTNTFYFLDSISFSTILAVDESAYFYIIMDEKEYILPEINGEIVISRSIFQDDTESKQIEVWYTDKTDDTNILITDSLILDLLPLNIDD